MQSTCMYCGEWFNMLDDRDICPGCREEYAMGESKPNEYDHVKDSGERQEFTTGAVRDKSSGKGRFDLLPAYVLFRDARHMENGAVKYGDRNWEKGIPLSRFMDSAIRHICCYQMGMRDEDHLAAARWNLGGLIWTEEMIRRGKLPAELNDLPEVESGS
jgi:hypothetical protein